MARIKPKDLTYKFSDQFFFDTNIWILLFAPISNYQKTDQRIYSNLLGELITRNKPIYINSIILSEFTNVLLRIDYNSWISENNIINPNYKNDFVGSTRYKSSVEIIKSLISKILEIDVVDKASDGFNSISIENVFSEFGNIDFNDSYIAEISKMNRYKLVTNDSDFISISDSIDVITTK